MPDMFKFGARVYIDGQDEAIIQSAWPEGTYFHPWPHYKVNFINGDKNVVVNITRVGAEKFTTTKIKQTLDT